MASTIESLIILSWFGGLICFTLNLLACLLVNPPKLEMDLVKRINSSCKVPLFCLVILQIPLMFGAGSKQSPVIDPVTVFRKGSGDSWNFGWGRPSLNLFCLFIGNFSAQHPMFRWTLVLGLVQDIILSCISAVDLDSWMQCMGMKKCVEIHNYTRSDYSALRARDCSDMFFAIWLLLLLVNMNVAIGFFSSRYTYRQLTTGDENRTEVMRKELKIFRKQRAWQKKFEKKNERDEENEIKGRISEIQYNSFWEKRIAPNMDESPRESIGTEEKKNFLPEDLNQDAAENGLMVSSKEPSVSVLQLESPSQKKEERSLKRRSRRDDQILGTPKSFGDEMERNAFANSTSGRSCSGLFSELNKHEDMERAEVTASFKGQPEDTLSPESLPAPNAETGKFRRSARVNPEEHLSSPSIPVCKDEQNFLVHGEKRKFRKSSKVNPEGNSTAASLAVSTGETDSLGNEKPKSKTCSKVSPDVEGSFGPSIVCKDETDAHAILGKGTVRKSTKINPEENLSTENLVSKDEASTVSNFKLRGSVKVKPEDSLSRESLAVYNAENVLVNTKNGMFGRTAKVNPEENANITYFDHNEDKNRVGNSKRNSKSGQEEKMGTTEKEFINNDPSELTCDAENAPKTQKIPSKHNWFQSMASDVKVKNSSIVPLNQETPFKDERASLEQKGNEEINEDELDNSIRYKGNLTGVLDALTNKCKILPEAEVIRSGNLKSNSEKNCISQFQLNEFSGESGLSNIGEIQPEHTNYQNHNTNETHPKHGEEKSIPRFGKKASVLPVSSSTHLNEQCSFEIIGATKANISIENGFNEPYSATESNILGTKFELKKENQCPAIVNIPGLHSQSSGAHIGEMKNLNGSRGLLPLQTKHADTRLLNATSFKVLPDDSNAKVDTPSSLVDEGIVKGEEKYHTAHFTLQEVTTKPQAGVPKCSSARIIPLDESNDEKK